VFENAAVVVLPDVFAALRQLLLTRLLPCGRVCGVRVIRVLVSTMAAELREMTANPADADGLSFAGWHHKIVKGLRSAASRSNHTGPVGAVSTANWVATLRASTP